MTMTVAVIGNCQVDGIAQCLGAMLPGATTIPLRLSEMMKDPTPDRKAAWRDRLAACDLILAQHRPPARSTEEFQAPRLKEAYGRVVEFPAIAFNGFHPDCVYLRKGSAMLRGAMGPYHSAFLAACFLEGVPRARVPALFNRFSFASLGYPGAFDAASRHLQAIASRLGFDFAAFLDTSAPRVFMHTINHPTIGMLHEVARQALSIAGVAHEGIDATRLEDALARAIVWPVYPGLLDHLPGTGPALFQPRPGRLMPLGEFVARSYDAYDKDPPPEGDAALERACLFIRENVVAAA
jgi:hypothetical protein